MGRWGEATPKFVSSSIHGWMKLPLKLDGQWPRTVAKKKVVLVHSYGLQNNDKIKEPTNEVTVLPRKPSVQQGC